MNIALLGIYTEEEHLNPRVYIRIMPQKSQQLSNHGGLYNCRVQEQRPGRTQLVLYVPQVHMYLRHQKMLCTYHITPILERTLIPINGALPMATPTKSP